MFTYSPLKPKASVLIFDLDETLLDSSNLYNDTIVTMPTKKNNYVFTKKELEETLYVQRFPTHSIAFLNDTKDRLIYLRPHLLEFLTFCFDHFNVAFWSNGEHTHVKPEGLFLQAMDASHVALCTFRLDANGFETYVCKEAFDIGLHLPSFERILKCAKKDDTICLKAQSNGDVLEIDFENTQSNKVSHYELKLMLIDNEQVHVGGMEYDTHIKMHSSSFSEVCKDMQMLGDTCQFTSSSNTLSFDVHGDIGSGQTILQHDEEYT